MKHSWLKYFLVCVLTIGQFGHVFGQDSLSTSSEIFGARPEIIPRFPGGEVALLKFVENEVRNCLACTDTSGIVYVEFTVEIDGTTTNFEIGRGINSTLNNEAVRILSLMPKWEAGSVLGKPVPMKLIMPVKFN